MVVGTNLRKTTFKEKAFLRMIHDRLKDMGKTAKEIRATKVRALNQFRDEQLSLEDKVTSALVLNAQRYINGREYKELENSGS